MSDFFEPDCVDSMLYEQSEKEKHDCQEAEEQFKKAFANYLSHFYPGVYPVKYKKLYQHTVDMLEDRCLGIELERKTNGGVWLTPDNKYFYCSNCGAYERYNVDGLAYCRNCGIWMNGKGFFEDVEDWGDQLAFGEKFWQNNN